MIELSNKELFCILFGMCMIGFLICYLFVSYNIRAYEDEMNKEIITAGEIYLGNITFLLRNAEEMHNAFGTAYHTNHEGSFITIRNNVTKYNFIRICNHEILHLVFCNDLLLNQTQEEEYVQVLEDYVRFPICYELLDMVEK